MATLQSAQTTGHVSLPVSSPPHSPHGHSLYPPAASYGPANNTTSLEYPSHDENQQPDAREHSPVQVVNPLTNGGEATPAKPKQQRRKRAAADGTPNSNVQGKADGEAKVKKPRKPREPKDPTAPPRKRVKKEDKQSTASNDQPMDQIGGSVAPSSSSNAASTKPEIKEPPKTYGSNSDQFRAPARPVSSGHRYDPVRGTSVEIPVERPSSSNAYGPVGVKSPARSAPSIANLVDPLPSSIHTSSNPPRSIPSSAFGPATNGTTSSQPSSRPSSLSTAGVLDGGAPNESLSTKKTDSPPKATKAKDIAPPPLPGGGLPGLTNADFGRPSNRERHYEEVPNDCIVIDVPMRQDDLGGSYVNFLKEVENKYGFDVAHPRVAEHRRRMKEIAAAGAALESGPGSADEMNLDISEGESDVEIGGQGNGSNSDVQKKTRKVNERYDLEDEFIDDSEMIWQQQALASKDGYFVWSGPLIQEGDKPTVERADGTVKRGGRGGRGGSRGGAGRGDGTKTRGSRGGGPGSRGGATVRKPRVTKADRAKMDAEKVERERMAATAAKPTLYPGTVS